MAAVPPYPRSLRFCISSQPRRLILIVGSLALFSSFLMFTLFGPAETLQATSVFISDTIGNLAQSYAQCSSRCTSDPFTKPGMLVYGNNDSDTRWLPFPAGPQFSQPFNSSQIQFDAAVPEASSAMACPQYMKMLANSSMESSEMEWARNKTVLFIGSSHDRNNIQHFCEEVGGTYSSIGGHLSATCNVTSHNLVLALWFTYGAVDSESYDWFMPIERRPITFERRIEKLMLPWMAKQAIKDPALVIESSLFWDDSFFNYRARHLNNTHLDAPLTYSELAWHRSRIYTLVAYTRSLYGTHIPIMFRTRHIRQTNRWNRILRLFQMDQSIRAAARELGVKLFTWGDMLEGVTNFDDGDQHFPRGPVTWLFGDMVLFYLKRATMPGCWECYDT